MFMSKQLGANVYAQMGLETGVVDANPSRLVVMLYDGALLACRKAMTHIQNQDYEQKGLAQSLDGLYIYMIKQLTAANIANKTQSLEEVIHLLSDLKMAWESLDAPKLATQEPSATKTNAESAMLAQYQLSA